MDGFSPEVRAGLVNLIFSTYENDARACCDALEQMGILKVYAHVQLEALCNFSVLNLLVCARTHIVNWLIMRVALRMWHQHSSCTTSHLQLDRPTILAYTYTTSSAHTVCISICLCDNVLCMIIHDDSLKTCRNLGAASLHRELQLVVVLGATH
jgi:hypothetical protein